MTTLLAVLLMTAAYPEVDPQPVDAPPPDEFAETYKAPRHFEITMGFMGGVRDATRGGYAFSSGTAESIAGAQALTDPFLQAPFNRVVTYGLAWEARYVAQHVRFTMGLQKPFASFRMAEALFPGDVAGAPLDIGTRSLDLWDVRFGLGTEYAFKYVTPFVDVVGDVQTVSASMTIGGETATYKATTFGFSVRAGLRVHMGDHLFLAPMGELGFGNGMKWGASLAAGWVIPVG